MLLSIFYPQGHYRRTARKTTNVRCSYGSKLDQLGSTANKTGNAVVLEKKGDFFFKTCYSCLGPLRGSKSVNSVPPCSLLHFLLQIPAPTSLKDGVIHRSLRWNLFSQSCLWSACSIKARGRQRRSLVIAWNQILKGFQKWSVTLVCKISLLKGF